MLTPSNVNFQQVPQFGELNPATADAPPMLGNVGKDLNVVKPTVFVVSQVACTSCAPWGSGGVALTFCF